MLDLTLASTGALVFGIINIAGNFRTVFTDQAYWQRAIATRPKSAIKYEELLDGKLDP